MRASPQNNSVFSFSSNDMSNLFSGSATARDSTTPPGDADAAPSATASASGLQGTSGGGGYCLIVAYRVLILVWSSYNTTSRVHCCLRWMVILFAQVQWVVESKKSVSTSPVFVMSNRIRSTKQNGRPMKTPSLQPTSMFSSIAREMSSGSGLRVPSPSNRSNLISPD